MSDAEQLTEREQARIVRAALHERVADIRSELERMEKYIQQAQDDLETYSGHRVRLLQRAQALEDFLAGSLLPNDDPDDGGSDA